MTWAIIVLALVMLGGTYLYGKHRGKIEHIHSNLDEEREQDEKEAQDDLDEKNDEDAWDNLDDTLDDRRKRDRR